MHGEGHSATQRTMSGARTIWYVSKYVAPPQGESVGGRGYEIMRELAAQGHRSVIVTSDANHLTHVPEMTGPVLRQERDGLEMVWLRTFKAPKSRSWRRFVSWLHFEWRLLRLDTSRLPAPDAIIVSSLSLLTVLNGLRLRRRYRARLVFEVRDIWPLSLVEEGGVGPGHPVVRALGLVERLGYRRSDAIVGTMPGLGKHVREVLGEDREVHCVPMGYASRTVSIDLEVPARGEVSTSEARLVVGFAGTINSTSALEVLFDAVRLLRDEPGLEFRIIGDGPLLPRLREEYADLDNVVFTGRVSKHEVVAELWKCDLLYLSTNPSKIWEYGQSRNKVIDYMMSGRPVLASYSGYPSMIDEADSGTFVPAGDAAAVADEVRRYAAMDPAERDAMGRRGRTWLLEHRSFERLASDYLEILFPGDHRETAVGGTR
jgi:glycosyltransferase involved in cell wall biosynthesis